MKTKELKVKKRGRQLTEFAAIQKIANLKFGQSTVIRKDQWTALKTKPGQHMLRRHTGREFKVETLESETGWRVTALS